MKTIHKYKIYIVEGEQTIGLPLGAEILSIVNTGDYGLYHLYAKVDSTQITHELHSVYVIGTGQDLSILENDAKTKFLGTFIDAPFVWHIFSEDKGE